MDQDLLGLAFGAGLVAALNPCGFALLPAHLVLVVRGDGTGRLAAMSRAISATAAMTLGFLTVFGTFSALTVSAASLVQRCQPFATVLIGAGLVAVGIWLLLGGTLAVLVELDPAGRWAPTARIGSMYGFGVSYAIASLSCTVGPFLAVTGASLRSGSIVNAVTIYLAYGAGIMLIVGVLAGAVTFARSSLIERVRRILPYVNRFGGALVVLVGLYVSYYGVYEIRLFEANADPRDPVIAAAAGVQGALASWVHRYGGDPWVLALTVLALAAGAMAWRNGKRVSLPGRGYGHSPDRLDVPRR